MIDPPPEETSPLNCVLCMSLFSLALVAYFTCLNIYSAKVVQLGLELIVLIPNVLDFEIGESQEHPAPQHLPKVLIAIMSAMYFIWPAKTVSW